MRLFNKASLLPRQTARFEHPCPRAWHCGFVSANQRGANTVPDCDWGGRSPICWTLYGVQNGGDPNFWVQERLEGARITDIDAGGSCDFCQSGSLRAALYETLTIYPAAGGEQCKGLGK
ncbi:hypothetical protein E2P79_09465 [Aeromonas schubertii]|nr:hypothetical protein E2P79_09465 [Aeromonas schubertii]